MSQISVGREIRSEWGWLWARTKRLADLLLTRRILEGAEQMVEALDRYAALNDIPEDRISIGDAKFIKGLTYIEYPFRSDG